MKFSSSPAAVSEETAQSTGYEKKDVRNITKNRSFSKEVQGETIEREIEVTNWAVRYGKSTEMGELGEQEIAQFVTFTTPQVEIMGQSFNPVAEMSHDELVQKFVGKVGAVKDIEKVSETNIVMLGEGTKVSKYKATTEMNGMEIDVYIHLAITQHGDDHVGAVGVYPVQLESQEEKNVLSLMKSVEHEASSET